MSSSERTHRLFDERVRLVMLFSILTCGCVHQPPRRASHPTHMAAAAVVCGAAIVGTSSIARDPVSHVRNPTDDTQSKVKQTTNLSLSIVLHECAGVPRRTAVTAAAGVGAVGSLTTLALAYREPLNRCRCGRRKDKDDEDEDERASTATPRAFWPRAHCARCRKRTPAGVVMSFLFSPAYVAVASGVTALAAHVVGTKSLRAARASASAVSRFVARRRRHSSP